MTPRLLEPIQESSSAYKSSLKTGARSLDRLEGVELALLEARSHILGALDRELEAVRALKARWTNPGGLSHEVFQPSALPSNVLKVDREFFNSKEHTPPEAALDPVLERATIDELNAALAAAFRQMSAP